MSLSELKLFKPSLQLDKETQRAWADGLLKSYKLEHAVQAIEQVKHSDCQWVNFGTIATEARRISAARATEYRPYANPSRLSLSQLETATGPGCEAGTKRLVNDSPRGISVD